MSSALVWQRSSYCGTNACVAVAFDGPVVLVRNTGDSQEPLRFSRAEWTAFLAGAKAGEFEVPGA